jgi:hypothetical protein
MVLPRRVPALPSVVALVLVIGEAGIKSELFAFDSNVPSRT